MGGASQDGLSSRVPGPGDLSRPLGETLMAELVAHASEILVVQARLRTLLRANRTIVAELSLAGVLRRIVEAAREVAGAKYAALGVIGADGLLEQFIHIGMDETTVEAIGQLPKGRGLLGALIEDPEPIRVSEIADDSRSSGFPAGHPAMHGFLGVPIRLRDQVFGNLYLTEPAKGSFTDEDEELVSALAATASVAIENARLYEESRRGQEWLRASIEVQRTILASNEDSSQTLQRIAENALRLATADVVSIVRPTSRPDQLEVAVAVGVGEEKLQGLHYPTAGSLAWEAMTAGHGMIGHASDLGPDHFVHLSSVVPVGPVMTSPLIGEGVPRGAIVVGRRPDGRPFTPTDLDVAESFANQAALALELADSRDDQQRLTILEDRDRIARDLHDHVIQRLFATGLSIQAAASMMPESEVSARLRKGVEDLDETIKQVRTSIFQLRDTAEESSLRNSVLQVVEQAAAVFGFTPRVQFEGPLDTAAQPTLVDDVQAVVREALTNAAKYAHATEVEVIVTTDVTNLVVTVLDNGTGMANTKRRSGIANLKTRAEQRAGSLFIRQRTEGGTELCWTVPTG